MKYNEMSKAQRVKIMLQGIMECVKELTEEEQNKIFGYCGLQKINHYEDFPCYDFKNKDGYQKIIHAKWIADSRQKFTNSNIASIDENGNPFIKKKLVKVIHYKCSSCNEIFDDNSLYCPECGARMDLR